jgi:hypothetical protein
VPILSIALLLAAFSAQAAAPRPSAPGGWPLTHVHEASTPLERIPPVDRSVAFSLLKPYLGPLFQGESTQEMNQAIRSFRAERLTLAGGAALAVQPSGSELCGATGNCSFWIVDLRHRRILLNADGIQSFAVTSSKSGAMPEIITSSHASAYQQERIRWRLQGSSYRQESCATVDSADDAGQTYPTPTVTPHPCPTEGN